MAVAAAAEPTATIALLSAAVRALPVTPSGQCIYLASRTTSWSLSSLSDFMNGLVPFTPSPLLFAVRPDLPLSHSYVRLFTISPRSQTVREKDSRGSTILQFDSEMTRHIHFNSCSLSPTS